MPHHRLIRFVAGVGWIACGAVIGAAVMFPAGTRSGVVQWSPWLLGLAVLGVPHGALDHRIHLDLPRGDGGAAAAAGRVGPGFYATYLAAAVLVLGAWAVAPMAASLGFLAVAAAHFGQGDVYWSRQFGLASCAGSSGYQGLLLWTRSIIPIALPLLAWPDEFAGAAAELARRLFGQASWSVPPAVVPVGVGLVLLSGAGQVVWAVALAWGRPRAVRRLAGGEIVETALLVVLFVLVPPVLALGVYFNAWHSLRHITRLILISAATRDLVAADCLGAASARFARQALPMTGGALALVALLGLGIGWGRPLGSPGDIGPVVLVALSALTLPHVLIVALMDARQGIWAARAGRSTDPGVDGDRAS